MDKKQKIIIIISLIVFTFIAFGPVLQNDFIDFDDDLYITENQHIKSGINIKTIKWAFGAVVSGNWHPLTLLSHALDWSLFSSWAGGHHFVSLLFHIGAVLFLFLFLSKTTQTLWPAAFVAAFFALHPLRVESVAWASERKDVLSMFFGMAALYSYAFYVQDKKISRYLLCLFLFVLALMSKPMMVTLPFILLLMDYWPLGRWQIFSKPPKTEVTAAYQSQKTTNKKSKIKKTKIVAEKIIPLSSADWRQTANPLIGEKIPFFILTIFSSIVTVWAQNKGGLIASLDKLQLSDRVTNAIGSYVAYLVKIFWPVDLALLYPYQSLVPLWQIFLAAIILTGITISVVIFMKKTPFLFVGWFLYLGTLVPVIGLVQVGVQAMADRYTYLPSIGIAIMLTWGLLHLVPQEKMRKIFLLPVACVLIFILTILTWQQCGYWKDSFSIWSHTLSATKNNYLVYNNIGVMLFNSGKNDEAIGRFLEAIKINPWKSSHYYNLGMALAASGKNDDAIVRYLQAIDIKPDYEEAHYMLAEILAKQGKITEAENHYLATIKINPQHDKAHYNLAELLVQKGLIHRAIEHLRESARLNPASFKALNNLGVHLEGQQLHDEAIYYYRQAMKLEPENPGLHFNLGVALGNKGDLEQAIEHFRRAIEFKPDYQDARRALKLAQDLQNQKR